MTQKYNALDPVNLSKLVKLLPDNVDNIRLILEIEKVASPYGMALENVKYSTDTTKKDATKDTTATQAMAAQTGGTQGKGANLPNKDYGVWNLEFSTKGTYNNFLNFIKDLENNLRIVDISSIQFSSDTATNTKSGINPSSSESYVYNFVIKTYWLKN